MKRNNTVSHRLIYPLLLALVLLGPRGSAAAAGREADAIRGGAPSAVIDREPVQLLEAWLAGEPVPATSTDPQFDPLADWRDYLKAQAIPDATAREKALRGVYGQTPSPLLRMIILRAITENPEFQGRQALFIRHYGFYANWFNRIVFSVSRLVQFNIQAMAQLAVDGVNELFGALFSLGEADSNTRRAYDLLRRAQAESGPRSAADAAQLAKLERSVLGALAASDLDQAQYALTHGDPEAAVFYAGQARLLRPDWKKAETFQSKAGSEAARLRRDQLASSQVGYPDRTPTVEPADPELLRAILASRPHPALRAPQVPIAQSGFLARLRHPWRRAAAPETAAAPGERLVTAILSEPPPPRGGQATRMRPWKDRLREDPDPGAYAHRWLTGLVYDPQINIDQRLAEARSQYRSNTFKFIFLGPERPRERVYKTATWITQAWDAMQNIGIFYVFEVGARAGQAVWSPPVPGEEILDAQAAWLHQAPDPKNKEARKIAEHLQGIYMKQNRYDDARAVLETAGLLTAAREQKINRDCANWLLDYAQKMPAGPDREAIVKRIAALAPGSTAAAKAARIAEAEKKHAELQTLALDWDTLSHWTGAKPPCGLPGDRAWFDGNPANGEYLKSGLVFERRSDEPTLTLRYRVQQQGEERVHQVTMAFKNLPAPVQHWFEISTTQRTAASQTIKQLNRLPIPFAVEADAGPSGVDLYPKLLPIKTKPGEIELYR